MTIQQQQAEVLKRHQESALHVATHQVAQTARDIEAAITAHELAKTYHASLIAAQAA